jgi:hypothetical protein
MIMDAECVAYAELMSGSAVTSERRKWSTKLATPLGRVIGAFPAKMVIDLSWLADPLSIAVLIRVSLLPFFGLGAFGSH